MGTLFVLVSPCFREAVTCKIGSFFCNLDNLLQKKVNVSFSLFFFWKSNFKMALIWRKGLLLTFFSHFKSLGKSYKSSFSTYLTHIHTFILLTLLTFLPYQFWKKYQFIRYGFSLVSFLVLILIRAILENYNK